MGLFTELERNNKIIHLYELLTRSDFKGNYEDTYTIEVLFTMLNIDLIVNAQAPETMSAKDILELAKDIVRVFETENNEFSYYSVRNWIEALFEYMSINNLTYKDIHKESTITLRNNLKEYLQQGDE